MKRYTLLLSIVVLGLMAQDKAVAADCVWSGGTGDWEEPANWSDCNGGIPTAGDEVLIGSGQANLNDSTVIAGLHFSGGVINGAGMGSTTLTVTDSLLFDGGEKSLARLTLVLEGDGQWTAGDWRLRLPAGGATQASFVIAADASFEMVGALAMLSSDFQARITNEGNMTKTGAGLVNLHASFGRITNLGTVEVQEGVLRIPGSVPNPHQGSFSVVSGARLELDGPQHHFGAGSSISGAGDVHFPFNGAWIFDAGSSFAITGATVIRDSNSCPCMLRLDIAASTGSLQLGPGGLGSAIEGIDGQLTVNGSFDWRVGTVGRQSVNGDFVLDLLGGLTLQGGISGVNMQATVHNRAAASYIGGTFYIRNPSARFINHAGASFTIQGNRIIEYRLAGSDRPFGVFDNRGSLIKADSGVAEFQSLSVENSGLIDIQEGSLRFVRHSFLSQPGEGTRLIMLDGTLNSVSPVEFAAGQLRGQGAINADVELDGFLFPGFSLPGAGESYQAGILEINGNLDLVADSRTFAVLVSDDPNPGTGFSQVQVDGSVNLAGQLSLRIDDDFVEQLEIGDQFLIMTCSQGCIGSFNSMETNRTDFGAKAVYQANQVLVEIVTDEIFHSRFEPDS
jgi:hypothetical protein